MAQAGTKLTPEQLAQGLLNSNLGQIAKVQTLLAREGIELHLATAEIHIEEQSEQILGPKPHSLQTKRE